MYNMWGGGKKKRQESFIENLLKMQEENEFWKYHMLLEISEQSMIMEQLKKNLELCNQDNARLQQLHAQLLQTLQGFEMEKEKLAAIHAQENAQLQFYNRVLKMELQQLTQTTPPTMRTNVRTSLC
ncbi:hypothetical protein RFI_33520 [Reticulomyxa filosa]|uniref:Uncharacterized protein n=1 Tax=Reticulomyxa filosa TaxID=46433 RepID=X6LS11_RETFI|nr:hypothetical protein RFI_33520 [Reticulomyxa filosa]|eukprot:ETO03882.1 hypothetical protein RFI_33520 [Reticulomyxa filosa]